MKTILTGLLLLIGMNLIAQNKTYDISKDEKNGDLVFNGPLTFDDLNSEPTFSWLKKGYEEYKPYTAAIDYIKNKLKDQEYSMVVFLGTWCDDSHELVPKLEKVLKETDFPLSRVTMYGVDREKKTKNGEHEKYKITLVPTVILIRKGDGEVGRITETVTKSIEEDLVKFFPLTLKEGGLKPLK